jgi:hypothetical protein
MCFQLAVQRKSHTPHFQPHPSFSCLLPKYEAKTPTTPRSEIIKNIRFSFNDSIRPKLCPLFEERTRTSNTPSSDAYFISSSLSVRCLCFDCSTSCRRIPYHAMAEDHTALKPQTMSDGTTLMLPVSCIAHRHGHD